MVCACLHFCYISCHIVVAPIAKIVKLVRRSCPCEGRKKLLGGCAERNKYLHIYIHKLKKASALINMSRKFWVGGNWKMNGDKKGIENIVTFLKAGPLDPSVGKDTPY